MDDRVERNIELTQKTPSIIDGTVFDFESLPKDLGMPPRPDDFSDDQMKLGPLEFDYTQVKQEVQEGKSKLRLIRDDEGTVMGFSVVTPGEVSSTLKMLWVNPQYRRMKLGEKLLHDAVQILPQGTISMDIWGGIPMTKLVTEFGFVQNPGGNMTNRYSLLRPSE